VFQRDQLAAASNKFLNSAGLAKAPKAGMPSSSDDDQTTFAECGQPGDRMGDGWAAPAPFREFTESDAGD
jgi:hypothetical protein